MITLHCRPAGEGPTEVRIGRGIAAHLPEWLRERSVFAFVDAAVESKAPLATAWPRLTSAAGESGKTLAGCEALLRAMLRAGIQRSGLLLAVGGGAIGDVAGLAASLYLRGIDVWQVPTTLLAMVDSAVGGKTAVNLPEGKNLVGTIHPAQTVVVDVEFVRSLPERDFLGGLAEAIKMAIGFDQELFALLERQREAVQRRDEGVLIDVVYRSLAAKIAVVEGDLRETGSRRHLNLGHTLGHALEAHSDYALPHGLAVARGLHFALELAEHLGALRQVDKQRCRELLLAYGFARDALPPAAELLPFVRRDKKAVAGTIHFVVPTAVGACETRPVTPEQLAARLAGS